MNHTAPLPLLGAVTWTMHPMHPLHPMNYEVLDFGNGGQHAGFALLQLAILGWHARAQARVARGSRLCWYSEHARHGTARHGTARLCTAHKRTAPHNSCHNVARTTARHHTVRLGHKAPTAPHRL